MTFSTVWYGVCRNSQGNLGTDKLPVLSVAEGFTGQRLDDTGLYYYGARYYDPEIGRFISADTIIPNPTNPQSFNRYSYCLNNPLKYIDPSGEVVEFVSGDTSISTELWYCDDPDIWVFVNDLIPDLETMSELVSIANEWEEFILEDPDTAEYMEEAKEVYDIDAKIQQETDAEKFTRNLNASIFAADLFAFIPTPASKFLKYYSIIASSYSYFQSFDNFVRDRADIIDLGVSFSTNTFGYVKRWGVLGSFMQRLYDTRDREKNWW